MMRFPEQYRKHHPLVPFKANDPEGGWFRIPYNSIFINCLANAGRNWEHAAVTLSAPNRRINRCPFWNEMQYVKLLFWEAEDAVMQLHPPESEYINNHPYSLHLWRPVNVWIPMPPNEMVGVK